LFAEMERAKLAGHIYIDTAEPMPFDMPYKHKGATFEALPLGEIFTELGLHSGEEAAYKEMARNFRHLAPFLESYFAKSTSEINQKLRRRLHWLAD
jgi:hypothetical protein